MLSSLICKTLFPYEKLRRANVIGPWLSSSGKGPLLLPNRSEFKCHYDITMNFSLLVMLQSKQWFCPYWGQFFWQKVSNQKTFWWINKITLCLFWALLLAAQYFLANQNAPKQHSVCFKREIFIGSGPWAYVLIKFEISIPMLIWSSLIGWST